MTSLFVIHSPKKGFWPGGGARPGKAWTRELRKAKFYQSFNYARAAASHIKGVFDMEILEYTLSAPVNITKVL